MEINKWLLEDVACTLHNFSDKFLNWETLSWEDKVYKTSPYGEAALAALIVAKQGFGDCFPVDIFIKEVERGAFMDYDGSGAYVDENGNEICAIKCDVEWLKTRRPKNAKFIMWYNK